MKKLILSLSLAFSFNAFNQTNETTKLVTGKVDKWYIEQSISNSKDTTTYFYWGFKNMDYNYITDIASILFIKKTDLDTLALRLKEITLTEKGVEKSITYKGVRLSTTAYDGIIIYIVNDGWTMLNRKLCNELADEFLANSYFLK